VSGSSKTTVAAMLARRLQWPFIASDNLHSPATRVLFALPKHGSS